MRQIKISENDRPIQAKRKPKVKKASRTAKKTTAKPFFGRLKVFLSNASSLGLFKKQNKRSKASSRRKPSGIRLKTALLAGGFTAVTTFVGFSGYLIVKNGFIEQAGLWAQETRLSALGGVGMVVQEVSVTGREKASGKDIMAALGVARGDSIVDFDPDLARARIEKLGWVEHASVMRRYPDEIFVRLQERRPFARWQINGKTTLIDRKGAVIATTDTFEFHHLPKVVGEKANERAAELFDLLSATPTLFTRLQNAVRVRDRRWDLEFGNGVKVLLPEEGSAVAWSKLNDLQKSKNILNKGVLSIDLRSSDKMYVRLRPADAEFRRDGGNKT
ncbi:MAG: cell division protein FtsQ/DivIB [Pseudomonas marincola]